MEIWKDIAGYEGLYKVSNLGNVKSLERFVNTSNGISIRIKEKILKHRKDGTGYLSVNLSLFSKAKTFSIHRLVAVHFLLNSKELKCVNHINGIKTDNRVENLEWCSHSHNTLHAFKLGINLKGEDRSFSKITNEQVSEIKISKLKQKKLAELYNVDQSLISRIKSSQRRKAL
jgi:hypothetical protein